jgi:hypothetical protein
MAINFTAKYLTLLPGGVARVFNCNFLVELILNE